MKRVLTWVRTASLIAVVLTLGTSLHAQAAAAGAAQSPPKYTTAEYNDYMAAKNTADPAAKIKALDGFMMKYPMSELMPFIDQEYYTTYLAQKNYPKTLEYIDKYLALGDKIQPAQKVTALYQRGQVFTAASSDPSMQTPEALMKARQSAQEGLMTLASLQKPANASDQQFEATKKTIGFMFRSVDGIAASYQKDYKAAQNAFKEALMLNPEDNYTHYRLGVAYLQDNPPDANDGFWELGRAIALKIPGDAQVRTYMRARLVQYQMPGCDKAADEEINKILMASAAGAQKPADLNIPSTMDLQMARDDTMNFLPWLKEGGTHGEVMWLATCGLEFPDVAVRVMEIVPGDAPDKFTLRVFRAPTEEEMKAATDPNMEVHVTGQPDVKKIPKDDYIRFTGTLSGYQQSPFLLTWDDAKVNSEDLADIPAPGAPAGRGRGGAGRGRGGQ